jgi:NADH-quinone oxidoreductase subunit C/D
MSRSAVEEVTGKLPKAVVSSHDHRGDDTLVVQAKQFGEVMDLLKGSLHFDMLVDVCGADYLGRRPDKERFEVVYHLLSTRTWKRVRVKVPLPAQKPTVDTMSARWPLADWFEREVFDMYGVAFKDHPDLRRLLCHRDFPGHPLRKDYPKEGRPAQVITEPVPLEEHGFLPITLPNGSQTVPINFGPAHPITHGVLRIQMQLDGETIVKSDTEIGYLHRCMEKEAENTHWDGVIPYCDRLNYCSTQMNTLGYCMAVEKLAGIEVTERAKVLRVIINELGRIMDHCVCLGPNIIDLGALTPYWYFFQLREVLLDIMDRLSGSRMTNSYVRIGGLARDVYDGFTDDVRAVGPVLERVLRDIRDLVAKNRIFLDRTVGVGCISRDQAVAYGLSGPMARASGLEYDIRKVYPYYHYDEFEWEMVVGVAGDTHDRIMCRFEEMWQSWKIVQQALEALPDGPVNIDRPDLIRRPLPEVHANIEALAGHFMHVINGPKVPDGEAYGYHEAANGELGFYLVSDGSGTPHRVHCRAPCLAAMQVFDPIVEGHMIADASAFLGSLNIIAGELDR